VDFVVPLVGLPARFVLRVFFLGALILFVFLLSGFFLRVFVLGTLRRCRGSAQHKQDRGSSKIAQFACHISLSRGVRRTTILTKLNRFCRVLGTQTKEEGSSRGHALAERTQSSASSRPRKTPTSTSPWVSRSVPNMRASP